VCLGGSAQINVRAIDIDVIDLINRAERSSDVVANSNVGRGIITVSGSTGTALRPGYLALRLGPPAAIQLGGAWRVSPTNSGEQGELRSLTDYTNNSFTLAIRSTNVTLETRELPGFLSPTNRTVLIVEDATVFLDLIYSVVPPQLLFDRELGLGIWGTPATRYRLEAAPRPDWSSGWSALTAMTLSAGTNWVPGTAPTGLSNCFYRALWLSE